MFIEEQYTENNLEIDEEGTKTNINIRFNKRDIMSMKIWVEENTDNEHKVTLGSDFLKAVKPKSSTDLLPSDHPSTVFLRFLLET